MISVTKLMDTFYSCVSKAVEAEFLDGDGEYLVRTSRQDDEVKRLLGSFNHDTASLIDNLLVEQLTIGELREAAYFRAGFCLALELTR